MGFHYIFNPPRIPSKMYLAFMIWPTSLLWKGLCDKILCIHVGLFKSVVQFYFVNCVIISYQFLFTSSFIQNMSFLGFQKA